MEICVYQFCLPFLQQLKEVSKSIKNICENMKKTLKNYQINKVNIFICVKLQQSEIFVSTKSVSKYFHWIFPRFILFKWTLNDLSCSICI